MRKTVFLIMLLCSGISVVANERPFISVKDFGAKGDGKTDDSEAIQSTIDRLRATGGEVFFPIGRYRVTKTLLIPRKSPSKFNNVIVLKGTGAGSVLIGDGVKFIISGGAKSKSYIYGVRFDSLAFTSFDEKKRCGGINSSYFLRWWCQNCYFYVLTTGICAPEKDSKGNKQSSWIIRIQNNLFNRCGNYAIKLGRVSDVVISNNAIEGCAGGIAVGHPGDGYDASANTLRIEDNVIEGMTNSGKPAILGSCWVGARIVGNYFESNWNGDIEITPKGKAGRTRGLVIESNTFQPTEKQLKSGRYGPIKLTQTKSALIAGNFTTGGILIHPESKLGDGVTITANTMNKTPQPGKKGRKNVNPLTYRGGRMYGAGTERFEVCGPVSAAGMNCTRGFYYKPAKSPARYIAYGAGRPKGSVQKYNPGDIILSTQPKTVKGKLLLGWICVASGKPGKWRGMWVSVELND